MQRLLLLQSRELSALRSCRAWAQKPRFWVALGPRCSATRGILPDQGSNGCLLPWQADSSPLSHQGSPEDSSKCLLATYISFLKKLLKSYASILPQTPLPSRLPRNPEQSSPCCAVGPCDDRYTFSSVCMPIPTPELPLLTPPCWQLQVCSLCWSVSFCFVSSFVSFFLDSTYKGCPTIVLPCLTDRTQCGSLRVHPCCCKWHHFILTCVCG